jgi:hypothetical protein
MAEQIHLEKPGERGQKIREVETIMQNFFRLKKQITNWEELLRSIPAEKNAKIQNPDFIKFILNLANLLKEGNIVNIKNYVFTFLGIELDRTQELELKVFIKQINSFKLAAGIDFTLDIDNRKLRKELSK